MEELLGICLLKSSVFKSCAASTTEERLRIPFPPRTYTSIPVTWFWKTQWGFAFDIHTLCRLSSRCVGT